MITRFLFRPASVAVLALAAFLVPYSVADNIITGIGASANASGAVLNNGIVVYQAPYITDSHSSLRDGSIQSESAGAASATGTYSSLQNVLVDTKGNIQQIIWQGQGSGSASATAEWGALHATATGSESVTPGTFTYMYIDENGEPQAVSLVTPLTAQGGAAAEAYYTDEFTVTSSSLAFGTPVDALFTFTLDGSSNSPDIFPPAISSFYDFVTQYSSDTMAQLYINSNSSLNQVSYLRTLYVGQVFGISADLSVHAGTPENCTPPLCDQQTFTSSAANTSKMFIDLQTSGVSLDSFSGHDYSLPTPTPEPATLTLFASGLAGLAGIRRRRTRR